VCGRPGCPKIKADQACRSGGRKSTSSAIFGGRNRGNPGKRWRCRDRTPPRTRTSPLSSPVIPSGLPPSGGGGSDPDSHPHHHPRCGPPSAVVCCRAPTPTNGPTIIDVTNQGDPAANFDLAHPAGHRQWRVGKRFSMLLTGNPTGPHNYTNTVLTPAMVTSG